MTDGRIRVRPMQEADLEAVLAIDRKSFPLPWTAGNYRYEIMVRLSDCWVAEKEGLIVGMLVGWLVIDEFQIATIAVDDRYRRQGIGSFLLRIALNRAKTGGAKTATLEVRKGNQPAQSLYASFGFRIMGDRPRFYANGEDAYIMTLPDLDEIA